MSITLHAELEELTRLGKISDSKDAACDPVPVADPPSANPPKCWKCGETVSGYSCFNCGAKPSIGKALRMHKRNVLEKEWHEKSLEGPKPEVAPPYPIPELDEEEHGEELCDDPHCNCHQDCEINECQVCLEKWIDDGEREADAAQDREMFG